MAWRRKLEVRWRPCDRERTRWAEDGAQRRRQSLRQRVVPRLWTSRIGAAAFHAARGRRRSGALDRRCSTNDAQTQQGPEACLGCLPRRPMHAASVSGMPTWFDRWLNGRLQQVSRAIMTKFCKEFNYLSADEAESAINDLQYALAALKHEVGQGAECLTGMHLASASAWAVLLVQGVSARRPGGWVVDSQEAAAKWCPRYMHRLLAEFRGEEFRGGDDEQSETLVAGREVRTCVDGRPVSKRRARVDRLGNDASLKQKARSLHRLLLSSGRPGLAAEILDLEAPTVRGYEDTAKRAREGRIAAAWVVRTARAPAEFAHRQAVARPNVVSTGRLGSRTCEPDGESEDEGQSEVESECPSESSTVRAPCCGAAGALDSPSASEASDVTSESGDSDAALDELPLEERSDEGGAGAAGPDAFGYLGLPPRIVRGASAHLDDDAAAAALSEAMQELEREDAREAARCGARAKQVIRSPTAVPTHWVAHCCAPGSALGSAPGSACRPPPIEGGWVGSMAAGRDCMYQRWSVSMHALSGGCHLTPSLCRASSRRSTPRWASRSTSPGGGVRPCLRRRGAHARRRCAAGVRRPWPRGWQRRTPAWRRARRERRSERQKTLRDKRGSCIASRQPSSVRAIGSEQSCASSASAPSGAVCG